MSEMKFEKLNHEIRDIFWTEKINASCQCLTIHIEVQACSIHPFYSEKKRISSASSSLNKGSTWIFMGWHLSVRAVLPNFQNK